MDLLLGKRKKKELEMNLKRNKLLLMLSFVFSSSLCVAGLKMPSKSKLALGQECSHSDVNFYQAKEPTLNEEGLNDNYYVCCLCHKKWSDSSLTNEIDYSSVELARKTQSTPIGNVSSEYYLLDKINKSSFSNITSHGLYLNDGRASLFVSSKEGNGLSYFSIEDLPANPKSISFKYKYYDLNKDIDSSGFHLYSSSNGDNAELVLKNDNLWHEYSLPIPDWNEFRFNIFHFVGELFISDISIDCGYSLDNILSSTDSLSRYFAFANSSIIPNISASFSSISQLGIRKTLIDEALLNGYTHMKLNLRSDSSLVNDIYLEGSSYSKVYSGNENDVRIDLRQISKGDYSSIKLNFRNDKSVNMESDVALSNIRFYKDDITASWAKSNNNLYVCYEGNNLIIDSCFAGNGAYVNSSSVWYEQFLVNDKVDIYFSTDYIKKQNNYRGVIYGKNNAPINDLPLGEHALLNQDYSIGDTLLLMLENEGVASISMLSEASYKQATARDRLSKALKEEPSFTSYFLTGSISSDTNFSSNNNNVYFSSKILGLKKTLLLDMAEAKYTNIAFDFTSIPEDYSSNGYFNHIVYTSDGLETPSSWKLIYDEFDTDMLSTSLHLDIDLEEAFNYSYLDDPIINIRARRNGSEGIDANQAISSLYFYNKNDLGKSFDISFSSYKGVESSQYQLNDALTIPSLDDTVSGVFKGWTCNGTIYKPGQIIFVNDNLEFIACFEEKLFSLKDNDYCIVYESNNKSAMWAANDLKKYIFKTIGVTPNVIEDKEYNYSNEAKAFSIGNTTILENTKDVVVEDAFVDVASIKNNLLKKDDSFAIASRRNVLYLFGNNSNSLRYASTKFIENNLGVAFFSTSEEKVPSLDGCIVKNGGKIYNPYFDFRTYLTSDAYSSNTNDKYDYNSHFYNDSDYASSCSINEFDNTWLEGHFKDKENKDTLINTAHNSFSSDDLGLVKLSTYPANEYPNMWFRFNDSVIDIHYSDGIKDDGSIDRSTSATDTAAEAMYDSLKAILSSYYSKNSHDKELFMSIGQADTNECCKCDKCLDNAFKYNNSGTMIRFYNAIINELKQDSVLKDCNFKLVMFAYQYNLFSPLIHKMDVSSSTSGIINKKTSKTINGYIYDESSDTIDSSTIPDKDHLYVRVAPLVMDQYLGIEDNANYLLQRFNGRVFDENANKWMIDNVTYGDRLGHYKASSLFWDWGKVTSNLISWYYDSSFSYGFATYTGSVSRLERFIGCIKENNFMGAFVQSNFKDNIYVDTLLNAYVYSHLCWDDNTLSAIELRSKFIDLYFDQNSSSIIKEYYEYMDSLYEEKFKDDGYGNAFQNINRITISELITAKNKLDEAYNSTSDELVKGRIQRLQLTPLFMLGKLDENWRVYFIDIFTKYGGEYVNESYTLNEYVW